mmetsp:Transcript_27883/g.61175  ORF Transcript_27883/g.61175 Transcript_27883/m.61175 type:complete len:325 (+) Transcript_27883:1066-2040(+)
MARPSATASTTVAKLSSASTISAALRATAVPEPMATPISARMRAGASFTPSPVIATTWPWLRSSSTSLSLCRGSTRLSTSMVSEARTWSSGRRHSNSAPVYATPPSKQPRSTWSTSSMCRVSGMPPDCAPASPLAAPPPGASRPSCRATASAVALLSPVTMTTLMPAALQVSRAARHSGRGGSCNPTMPSSVRPLASSSGRNSVWLDGSRRAASARHRSACLPPSSAIAASTAAAMAGVIGTGPSPGVGDMAVLHRDSTDSGAPLHSRRCGRPGGAGPAERWWKRPPSAAGAGSPLNKQLPGGQETSTLIILRSLVNSRTEVRG